MIYDGQAITVKLLDDGIAQLDFNLQGESVNKFNRVTLQELKEATEALQGSDSLKGVVVTSSKDVFIVGC